MASTEEFDPSGWRDWTAERLRELDLDWVVAGALAAQRYRLVPRYTTDADFLLRWDERLIDVFEALGFDVKVSAQPGDVPHLLQMHKGEAKIDLIIAEVAYQAEAIERGLAERVLTVEDVIIHKLIAWRPKDQDDIASILAAGHELDEAYLDRWIAEWEVEDRWQEARRFGR